MQDVVSVGHRPTDWALIDDSFPGSTPQSTNTSINRVLLGSLGLGTQNGKVSSSSQQQLSLLRVDMESTLAQKQSLEEECLRLTTELQKMK